MFKTRLNVTISSSKDLNLNSLCCDKLVPYSTLICRSI